MDMFPYMMAGILAYMIVAMASLWLISTIRFRRGLVVKANEDVTLFVSALLWPVGIPVSILKRVRPAPKS